MGKTFNFRHIKGNFWYLIFFIHFCTVSFAIGISAISKIMKNREDESIGFLELNFTGQLCTSFYACTGCMIGGALLGFYGLARKYSGGIVVAYSLVSFIAAVISLWSGAISIYKTQHHNAIKESLFTYMDHYDKDNEFEKFSHSTKIWDDLQIKFKCCGIDDYRDWQFATCGLTTLQVPFTCCKLKDGGTLENLPRDCGFNFLPEHENASIYLNSEGCLKPLIKNLNSYMTILGSIGIAIGGAEICLGIFACFLILTKRV